MTTNTDGYLVINNYPKGMFGTLNVDYIRNSNLYYWNKRHCNGITITIDKFGCYLWKACKR